MRFVLGLAALVVATTLYAVQPQFWKVTSPDDFLAGEIEGMAVNSRGELRLGPSVKKIASFSEPFVLSQTSDEAGTHYFGTGNEGKVYRLKGSEMKLLFTAAEPEIYAITFSAGALYVGSSPNGRVYRVDPDDGKNSVFFEPKQAYIWSIAPLPDDSLAVGTGIEGKLFKVDRQGKGSVLFDAPESHLRAIAVGKQGRILVGGSGEGRIYEVDGKGQGRALFDSSFTEISAIHIDPVTGIGWAAGVAAVPLVPPPPRPDPAKTTAQTTPGGSDPKKDEQTAAAAAVDVSFSFDDFTQTSSIGGGSGELYRIDPDGYVELVRKFDREMIYAISGSDGTIVLSTGPLGRIYEYRAGEIALIGVVPEKQVVSFSREGGRMLVTTTNSGAVYSIERIPSAANEYRSAVKDTERFSRFGHFLIEGKALSESGVSVSFRSGNTNTPDETWSPWVAVKSAAGSVTAPQARYLQWKINLEKPASDASVTSVAVAYMNRNVPPVIESVIVNDPGVVFIGANYPASPQVLEATNPDEYGIFSSLDSPRDRNEPGKRFFRKGYRTISWRASDPNGDSLRYSIHFRRQDGSTWLKLRENVEDTQINFDTSQLPDGTYEVRLSASDAVDNPEQPLTDAKEQIEFVIDNTLPRIQATTSSEEITITVSDALSPVGKVEYAIDAQKWSRLLPVDGIADSKQEVFKLQRKDVQNRFVVVRAVDAFYNVATESVRVP